MKTPEETADVSTSNHVLRHPWLVISSASGVHAMPMPLERRMTIGRMPSSDIVIEDDSVSREHAVLHNVDGQLSIEDLGSRNKTRVVGRSIQPGERIALSPGAVVEIGTATMFIQVGRPPGVSRKRLPATDVQGATRHGAIVADPTMLRLYALVDVIAPSTLNVLVFGETGTGKELFAEAIHRGSVRKDASLLKVNCAVLAGPLLESALFGHEKGAFTGATATKPGLFEAADGGTVFLDEIGELPLDTQAKLLRVIEYGEVYRLGSVQPRKVDVRFIGATHRELPYAITQGTFRSDLYFRLNGFSVTLPPLRQRKAEIPLLAAHFIERAAQGRRYSLTPNALAALTSHLWPGNLRELKNVVERACVMAGPSEWIDVQHLGLAPATPLSNTSDFSIARPPRGKPPGEDPSARAHWEKQQIIGALERTGGNQTEAAKLLGIALRTLINRLDAYGIPRPRKR
jgi:two-component system, NtrC family, response regulator AtoC